MTCSKTRGTRAWPYLKNSVAFEVQINVKFFCRNFNKVAFTFVGIMLHLHTLATIKKERKKVTFT